MLDTALAESAKLREHIHVRGSLLVACARALPVARRRPAWTAAIRSLAYLGDTDNHEAERITANLSDDELPWLAEVLAGQDLPQRARELLAAGMVEYVAEQARAGVEIVANQIATAREPADALRIARAVARHVARTARSRPGAFVAQLAGLG